MAGAAPRIEGDSSNFDEKQRVIECSQSVIHDIRAMVLERFNRIAHGGPEVFGVLFGTHQGRETLITAFQPLAGEGGLARVPVFAEEDRAAFASVLAAGAGDGEPAKLEPVGFFRAHPRSDLGLTERDCEIFNSLFTEPWHVAMIVRPGNSAPSRVRIFFREADGSLRAEGRFREFMQDALETVIPSLETTEVEDLAANVEQDASEIAPGLALESWPPGMALEPRTADEAPKSIRLAALIWPAVLIVAAVVAIALYWTARPQTLALGLLDSGGQLRITWDRDAGAVQRAAGAHLEITDGSGKVWIELDREQLRNGNVTYTRQSNNVTVRLKVDRPGAQPVEEMARFLGALPAGAASSALTPLENGSASREKLGQPGDASLRKPAELVVSVPVQPVVEPNRRDTAPPLALPPQPVRPATQEMAAPPQMEAHNAPPVSLPTPLHAAPPLVEKPSPVSTASGNNNAAAAPSSTAQNSLTAPVVPRSPAPPATSPAQNNNTSVANPSSAAQNGVRPPAVPRAAAVPVSGRLIWIGRLQKNQVLTISGKSASTGAVIGELPGKRVKVSVSPGDLSSDGIVLYTSNLQYANNVVEPPSAENGWNKTIYTWNPRYANDVIIEEAPAPQNEWARIALRSKNPKLSVFVIDWALVN